MNKLILIIGLVTILCLTIPIFNLHKAQAASDHAEAIVGKKTYKFDWDYQRESADEGVFVIKNTKAHQDTVSAKSGSIIGARVFYCCEDGEIEVALTKDKVKVKHAENNGFEDDTISFGNLKDAQLIKDCDTPLERGCQQDWQLPSVKKGTYSLFFGIFGSDEVNEYYLTKIKISK